MDDCGCGRSPNGKCIGWHGLSEEEYQEKLKEYEENSKGTDQHLSVMWFILAYFFFKVLRGIQIHESQLVKCRNYDLQYVNYTTN